MDIVKKFLFLILIFGFNQIPVCALDVITLETDSKPVFSGTVLDVQEADDNPVVEVDENTVYGKEKQKVMLAGADNTNQTLKSGIADYHPEDFSSKFFLLNILSNTAKDIYNLEIERTDVPSALLKDKLTFDIPKGPVESMHIWTAFQSHFTTEINEDNDTNSKFDVGLINVLIDGKFRGEEKKTFE